MGEYIKKQGIEYKIGTCENLYYTTYSELKRLDESGLTEANDFLKIDSGYRFRFPFPDEDHAEQFGLYEDFERGVLFSFPKSLGIEIAHGTSFYRTDEKVKNAPAVGFRLPCIASADFPVKKYDWDNTEGRTVFEVVQQKYVTDEQSGFEMFHLVVRCPYCGEKCRLSYTEVKAMFDDIQENGSGYTDFQKQIVTIAWEGYQNTND